MNAASTRPLDDLIHDPQFLAAILGGCLFWLALASIQPAWTEPDWPLRVPFAFVLAVLIYPVLEEIVFRGLIQGTLLKRSFGRRRLVGLTTANVVTSIAFVALHLINHQWYWALAVIAPSLLFGHFRERYDHLLPAIVLHMFYNAGYFWLFTAPA